LHDFLLKIDQGTFGIPCGGKVCHSSPGMDHVSWPLEKSAFLPRILAQLACQDFKKEPPDSIATLLSPQYSITSPFLQQLNFGSIIGDQVSFWTSHDSGCLSAFPKSLAQVGCHSFKIGHLAASMLHYNALMILNSSVILC